MCTQGDLMKQVGIGVPPKDLHQQFLDDIEERDLKGRLELPGLADSHGALEGTHWDHATK